MVRLPDAAGQVRNVPVKVLRGIFAGIGQLLLAADRFRAEETAHEPADAEQRDPLTSPGRMPTEHTAPESGQPPEQARFRSLDSTGNVRILAPGEESARPAKRPREPQQPQQPQETQQPPRPRETQQPQETQQPRRPRQSRSAPAMRQTPQSHPTPVAPRPRQPLRDPATQPSRRARQAPSTHQSPEPRQAPSDPAAAPALPVPGYDGLSLPSLRSWLRNLDAAQLRVLVAYERAHAGRPDVLTMFERRIAKLESPAVKAAGPDAS